MTKHLSSFQMSAFNRFHDLLSWNRFYVFLVFLPLFLSACGTVVTIDKNQSDLMPKAVAMSIFEKYDSKQWAEKPFMFKYPYETEKQFIEFNQIEGASYESRLKRLHFTKRNSVWDLRWITFLNVTESQALELTNAARALGATDIDQLMSYEL